MKKVTTRIMQSVITALFIGLIVIITLKVLNGNSFNKTSDFEEKNTEIYYSEIDMGWYRVVLRVGLTETTSVNGRYNRANGDQLTFHWWYQTNTGKWAEKKGEQTSSYVYPNVYAVNNPYTTSWSPSFTSLCKYFSVVSANPIRKP